MEASSEITRPIFPEEGCVKIARMAEANKISIQNFTCHLIFNWDSV